MGIFPVNVVDMKCRCQCILPEIVKTKQCRKSGSAHTSHQSTLLCIKAIGPDTLMSHQMKGLIFIRIVSFLEHRHIIYTTFMEILIFIHIHRINLNSDIFKILSRNLYRLSNICYIRIGTALTGKHQNFFHSRLRDDLHLMLNFFKRQLLPADIIVTVKSTINAVVLAIVGNVQRCKNIHCISKMIFCNLFCLACHLLQIRGCRRR